MRSCSRFAAAALLGAWLLTGRHSAVLGESQVTVHVKVFDPAPDGNGGFNGFSGVHASLNDAGQVGFFAALYGTSGESSDNTGIFRAGGAAGVVQIGREGQLAPGGDGRFFELPTGAPVINDAGQVAFMVHLGATSGGTVDNAGIYRGTQHGLVQIARKGQSVPGGNGIISNLDLPPVINEAGQVAFLAFLNGTSGGTADNAGIYRGAGGAFTEMVRRGQAVPSGNGAFGGISTPDLNDVGQVSFFASITTGGNGIYRGDGGAPVEIARTGQAAPGGNGTIDNLGGMGTPPLGDSGQVMFRAALSGTSGGSSDDSAIYRGDGGPLVQIARSGQAAPDGNGTIAGFHNLAVGVSDTGQTAFTAALTGTSGGAGDSIGIYRGDGGGLLQIVRSGQALPDGNGVFRSMGMPAINDAGQVAFITGFDGNTGGDALSSGIYLYDDIQGLIKVVRTGDSLLGDRIYTLRFSSGNSGANSDGNVGLNDLGQIAFTFGLEDGRSGIAVIAIPEPASIGTLSLGGLWLLTRRRGKPGV